MEEENLKKAKKKAEELAEKANLGSCVETNKKLVKGLTANHIHAELTFLPKQNHVVTRVFMGQNYILDPLLTKDYGEGNHKVLFTEEEHAELMRKVARKKPFSVYMDPDEVVYKKAEGE